MAKIPEAAARLQQNVFVCKRCKTKIKSSMLKVLQKRIVCKKCGSRAFRAVRKK